MNSEDFAIVVGINAYPQLTPLRGALQDANMFKNWLISPNGGDLPDTNVKTILSPDGFASDPFDASPIKRDIDRALRDFGLGNIDLDDPQPIGRRLYFYFSGHGVGPNFDEVAMLMADAGPNFLNNNVGMRPYRSLLHRLALFQQYVFIMDCCRDPVSGILPAEPAFTLPVTFKLAPAHSVQGFVVMAAAWGDKAFERPISEADQKTRLGVLTSHLIAGLNDPAAADDEGNITSDTLSHYLKIKMSGEVIPQKPEFFFPTDEIILNVIDLPTVTVRIMAPAGLTGELILRDGSFNEIDRRQADQLINKPAAWELSLTRNRVYMVDHTVDGQSVSSTVTLDLRNVESPFDFTFANTH